MPIVKNVIIIYKASKCKNSNYTFKRKKKETFFNVLAFVIKEKDIWQHIKIYHTENYKIRKKETNLKKRRCYPVSPNWIFLFVGDSIFLPCCFKFHLIFKSAVTLRIQRLNCFSQKVFHGKHLLRIINFKNLKFLFFTR